MRYLVQPRDQIFVEGYGFLSFAKNMGKIVRKNINKNSIGKYSQKPLNRSESPQQNFKLIQKESLKKQQKQLVIW